MAQQTRSGLTQRQINALAAALQRAHRALVEETGLRHQEEPFEAYFTRIAAPLSGETPAPYKKRIEGYLSALERASQASAAFRSVPHLQDTSPENQRCWRDVAHPLRFLPGRLVKTQAAWRREQAAKKTPPTPRHPGPDPPGSSDLGSELAQTLRLINSASEALRNARP